jgi:cytochrome P450
VSIPEQTYVLMSTIAANRDPGVFDDPDTFDVSRRPQGTMTFGFGMHFCLGAHLARAEMDVALRVLLERLPNLRLADADGLRTAGTIMRGPERLPVLFDAG